MAHQQSPNASEDRFDSLPEELLRLIAPNRPHDDVGFKKLKESYNFELTRDRRVVFTRLILNECLRIEKETGTRANVLDVGCGKGIGIEIGFTKAVGHFAGELWGIEPDEGIEAVPGVFTNYQHALMETAKLPEGHFDIAYSYMVMEHVADPVAYFSAVARCLKPGGIHYFMTPNGKHYFAIITQVLKAIKIEEMVLRIVRKQDDVDEYHYPVQYKCNTPKQITRAGVKSGFSKNEIAFIEEDGPRPYMTGPLRPIFHLLKAKRRAYKNPEHLLTLIARQIRD